MDTSVFRPLGKWHDIRKHKRVSRDLSFGVNRRSWCPFGFAVGVATSTLSQNASQRQVHGLCFKSTFDVFASVGPDNSFERLTERSVGFVADQPSDFWELFVTPFK